MSNYDRYSSEIELYEKEARPWHERSEKILKVYKDTDNKYGRKKRFNILWSNVETLKPALYARAPQPDVSRRFKDADKVGRTASEVLERAVSYTIDCEDQDARLKSSVEDRLLPGRGVMWHRYHPSFAETDRKDAITEEPEEELAYEEVKIDYVYWKDFGHNLARTWNEVWLVWRKVYLTREKLVDRFGEVGEKIPLDYTPKGLDKQKIGEDKKKACIYECWDKERREVVFLTRANMVSRDEKGKFTKGKGMVIETNDDELNLKDYFPCQKPLYATKSNDSLIPTPDYALYQTQAREIEDLTARINALQKALKVVGLYNTSAPDLARTLNEGYENKMIPVDEWAMFAEKGGMAGNMEFFPVEEVAKVVIALYEAREKSKQDLYEITGIADIIRGNSDPRETASAQQIKGRFAVLRISDSQQEVQRFARDSVRIIAEIIAEHFDPETIKQISGVRLLTDQEKQAYQAILQQQEQIARVTGQQGPQMVPPEVIELLQEPTWEEVVSLLRDDAMRNFRIDVETDSTVRTDEDAEKQERTEFLVSAGQYLERAVQASQMVPELTPLMAELMMFAVRGHKTARNLEPVFEETMKKLEQPKPEQPNPEMEKIKADQATKKMELDAKQAMEQQKIQAQAALDTLKANNDKEVKIAEQQAQAQEKAHQAELDDRRAQREHERDMEQIRVKGEVDIQVAREKAEIDANAKIEVARITSADKESERQFRERESERNSTDKEAERSSKSEQSKSRSGELKDALKVIDAVKELKRA